MNGLDASSKLSTISEEVHALHKVISKLDLDRDFRHESSTLNSLKERLEKEKSDLESKLQSVKF
ncbi:hypothetical protein CHH61_03590 [Shouchella clausii]|uniref:Uncharacterized protein n=1 Tax=Shouchella clausii TaxID=79880 RepID=A0A268S4H7_SHOCL|nr:hypothetical protein [Shouchella clausii]PAF27414.1 hypothetical protein CHH61_03590 [Shouchella clausii]